MSARLRKTALGLWFAPVGICLVYSLFDGFSRENYGAATMIHNGLNPFAYQQEGVAFWIGILLSVLILTFVWLVKPQKKVDIVFLSFVLASYTFAALQFAKNFHPG